MVLLLQLLSVTILSFFFNTPATTEIYTLSLHDALPICHRIALFQSRFGPRGHIGWADAALHCSGKRDRKSTRLNSSHRCISYAVFCLKKKKNIQKLYMPCSLHLNIHDPQTPLLYV